MGRTILRDISFITLVLLATLLVVATFIEKYYGAEVTREYVYHSPLFVILWMILAVSAMAYIVWVSRRVTLIMLHASLAVVLTGAFTSFMTSERGTILLTRDAVPASMFTTDDNSLEKLPFRMTLVDTDIYSSNGIHSARIAIESTEGCDTMDIALNSPAKTKGYSFCIKSISDEHLSLLTSYDPWGVPISYTGYLMTVISFIALFCDRKGYFLSLWLRKRKRSVKRRRGWMPGLDSCIGAVLAVIAVLGIYRWYSTGMFPITNGQECILFLTWLSFTMYITAAYIKALKPFAPIFFTLGCVALIALPFMWKSGGGEIPPILRTPLLGIHVSTVIAAYVLLGGTAINASVALWYKVVRDNEEKMERMAVIGRTLLYPATLLLTTGIFIGAMWADISWGRYWGWDPKEVWALITLIICSLTFHTRSLPFMAKALDFHIFSLVAFIAMLFTFFGVNYLFGGLHSYM